MNNNKHNLENNGIVRIVKAGALALGFVAAAKFAVGAAVLGAATHTACSVVQALVPNKETEEAIPSVTRRFSMAMLNPFSAKLEKNDDVLGNRTYRMVKGFTFGGILYNGFLALSTITASKPVIIATGATCLCCYFVNCLIAPSFKRNSIPKSLLREVANPLYLKL